MEEEGNQRKRTIIIGGAAALAVIAIIGGYFWFKRGPDVVPPQSPPAAVAAAPAPVEPPAPNPAVRYPIDESSSDHSTTLEQSDAKLLAALGEVHGWQAAILRLLVPGDLIRHIVATIDALPHEKVQAGAMPLKPVPGSFRVTREAQRTIIAASNERRYEAYVSALAGLDTGALVAVYRRFYPLFQQAYKELGYPKGYFNDRLVEVIDELLEAPDAKPPIEVQAPGVVYHYLEPDLEGLSAGQKILVRMGPSNESVVKSKLRELRQAVTAH